jgi:hypothetical protein
MFVLRAHGVGDALAWGFYMRVPLRRQNRELATPRGEKPPTHTTISSDDDGISAPIRKSPPHATSEPPPPHPTTHSSPSTLQTRCLLRSSERGRGRTPLNRRTGRISSRQRTTTNRCTSPSPLLRVHPRETTMQRNVDVSRIERREHQGGTRRKVLHLLFILFYSSYFNCISLPPPSFHCLSSFSYKQYQVTARWPSVIPALDWTARWGSSR